MWPQENPSGWTLSLLLPLVVLFICLSMFCFVREGKDKLGHVGIIQNMIGFIGQLGNV